MLAAWPVVGDGLRPRSGASAEFPLVVKEVAAMCGVAIIAGTAEDSFHFTLLLRIPL
jgi:hypothetical protein